MKRPRHPKVVDPRASVDVPRHPRAAFVADAVHDRFNAIEALLSPVIGNGGVVGLYERSRHISGRSFPWLALPEDKRHRGMDLESLKLLVAEQEDEAAAAGSAFLLKSFHDLLAGLVGEALTRQLLGAPPSPGPETGEVP